MVQYWEFTSAGSIKRPTPVNAHKRRARLSRRILRAIKSAQAAAERAWAIMADNAAGSRREW